MNRKDWQSAFGDVSETFQHQLRSTLNGLEEVNVKKKTRVSTMLIAAVLAAVLLAGAGIAATKLGVFHLLDTAEPIVPLEGAETLVGSDLGMVENELAKLTVEEAVFDGQGALVQLRIAPKDAEKYVMFDSMLQDAPADLFETEAIPVELPKGEQEFEQNGRTIRILYSGESAELLVDGEEVELPASVEDALAQDLPVYAQDGSVYYADMMDYRVLGSKDGRALLGYWPVVRVKGESRDAEALGLENFFDTMDAQGQADGSVIVWLSGYADAPLDADALEISCGAKIYLDGEEIFLKELSLTLPKGEEERKATFAPVGDGRGERFEILSGSINFTKVRGYFTLDYKYQPAERGEEMGITFHMYDADGNRITLGGSGCTEEDGVYHEVGEMQSFPEIPETIWLEAKVIGEDATLGRVECSVTKQ